MKLLVIGGTQFVGRHAVEQAVERGHEVTVFHRGESEPGDSFPDVEHVHGDRDGGLSPLKGRAWDAVLDTCGYVPRVVRQSARLPGIAAGHYTFVSSLSVYPDEVEQGATEATPAHRPPSPDTEEVTGDSYGPLKVACELEVQGAFPGRALIVRPGFIVGPHDPIDRFTYWVRRAAMGGEMLAPEPADLRVQLIDVRDLAAFVFDRIEAETGDVFNATGPEGVLTILLSPSGLRRHARVGVEELGQVAMPALVIWGEREPLGGVSVAQALTELMPDARLQGACWRPRALARAASRGRRRHRGSRA